ncbi:MAG: hypothetical protein NVS3B10_00120 [Polyangiales bacterium]
MGIEFSVDMKDGTSAPAGSAAQQVSVLTKQMTSLQTAMIKANALGDETRFNKLAGQYSSVSDTLQGLAPNLTSVGQAASQTGGQMGEMSAEMGAATGGISLLVEAIGAAVLAFGALVVAGGAASIQMAEFKKNTLAAFDGLTGSAAKGQALYDTINQLSQVLPESKQQLADTAKQLVALGLSAEDTKKTIVAMSAASALNLSPDAVKNIVSMSQEAGKFKATIKQLKSAGVTPEELAKALGMDPKNIQAAIKSGQVSAEQGINALTTVLAQKGGGAIAAKMTDMSTMFDKFKENVLDLFSGVGDTPGFKAFLGALQQLGSLFDQNSVTAKAMKGGITSAFGSIFGVAAKVLNWMALMLLKVATFGVRAYIWMFPMLHAFKQWADRTHFLDRVVTVLKAIGIAIGVLAAPFVVFGAVVVAQGIAVISVLGWLIGGFTKIAGIIWNFVKNAAKALASWVAGAADAAAKFVAGLTGGLAAGLPNVQAASKNLGDGAAAAMKKALDVHSPSRVMMKIGMQTAQGFGQGMSGGTKFAAKGASDMAGAATSTTSKSAAGGASASRGGLTVNFAPGSIVASGANAADLAEEIMALAFEKIALQQGLLAA